MRNSYLTAVCLAALEILPAEPSDLNKILRDQPAREALESLRTDRSVGEVVSWLCDHIDMSRVETWRKQIDVVEHELGARAILVHEPDYPVRLAQCWDAPPVLFVRGALSLAPVVAIVGSRAAGPEAVEVARALGSTSAGAGLSVVSGLAAGVDAAAHEGALAAGGHTAAVMGTGIGRIFPAENAELARRIVQRGGALVSQFSPDAPPTGTTFLRRNAVIAGWCNVDVVVDGHSRSGSRHQSEQAVRYGRILLFWRPTLGTQRWAREAVDNGLASFIDDPGAVLELM